MSGRVRREASWIRVRVIRTSNWVSQTLVVPVTGAFLVDILNVMVLTMFISLPFVGGF